MTELMKISGESYENAGFPKKILGASYQKLSKTCKLQNTTIGFEN